MKTPLCLFFVLLLSIRGCSQGLLEPSRFRDSSIQATLVQGDKYPRLIYTANGEVLSNRDILGRLRLYHTTVGELQQYGQARAAIFICGGIGLGAVVGAAVEKGQNNLGMSYLFGGIFLAAAIGEIASSVQAGNHLKKAIRIYNKKFVQ